MVSLTRLIVFVSIFTSITLKSNSQYFLPITKHEPTKQFYTTLTIGTLDSSPLNLLLDLGTTLTLLDCDKVLLYQLVPCHSSTCMSLPSYCDFEGIILCLYRHSKQTAIVVQDKVFISTTDDDRNFLSQVSFDNFTFSCANDKTIQDFPPPLSGILSLSPLSSSFTKQVTSAFSVPPIFSLCLPSSGSFGSFHIGSVNTSRPISMTSTPMTFTDSGDYLILVQSIYVEGTPLPLDSRFVLGGAKLSTVVPYTELHTDIYDAFAQSFTLQAMAMGISMVPSVAPFKHCFDARTVNNMTEPNVPMIEIGLPNVNATSEVKWAFYDANTLVKVNETVKCLAFIDGGNKPKDLMVIGTHQLQDYMIEFDFNTTALSFSESLLLYDSSCSTWPSQK
ncbi:putative aspartic proteinase GIP1 [Cardamine amara subsp. amara]|uniref:Aspartic proteinase GIP1 n=1 Tax=Cardamine amara subsp. amara TaxID=228776 RepID=A0ABD1AWX9_CARAN